MADMTTALQNATDRFLVGMSSLCDRLYHEALAKGATDGEAIAAVKATLLEFMQERMAAEVDLTPRRVVATCPICRNNGSDDRDPIIYDPTTEKTQCQYCKAAWYGKQEVA